MSSPCRGTSTLKAPELHVTYEGKAAVDQLTGAVPQQPGEGSRLSRLVAKDGSVVTIGTDRRVASDQVEFDAKADTALFIGDVIVNQQRNVLQGKRLFIDRKIRHEPSGSTGRGQPACRSHRRDVLSGRPEDRSQAKGHRRRTQGSPRRRRHGVLQDGSQRADGDRGRYPRRLRHRETGCVPWQRQVEARRCRRSHRGDDRLLHGPGRARTIKRGGRRQQGAIAAHSH